MSGEYNQIVIFLRKRSDLRIERYYRVDAHDVFGSSWSGFAPHK